MTTHTTDDFFVLIAPRAEIEEVPVPGRRPRQPDEIPDEDRDDNSPLPDTSDDDEEYIYEHPAKDDPML